MERFRFLLGKKRQKILIKIFQYGHFCLFSQKATDITEQKYINKAQTRKYISLQIHNITC